MLQRFTNIISEMGEMLSRLIARTPPIDMYYILSSIRTLLGGVA